MCGVEEQLLGAIEFESICGLLSVAAAAAPVPPGADDLDQGERCLTVQSIGRSVGRSVGVGITRRNFPRLAARA